MLILAEAVSQTPVNADGRLLHIARRLDPQSEKYQAINRILAKEPVARWLRLHEHFARFLQTDKPLVIVTDWSDPREVTGLRLETPEGTVDYPDLSFLALHTDWEDLSRSGIEYIFSHELSHVWLLWLGFPPECSQSNRFHTCTAITDSYLAFFEGFAEHFEIISTPRTPDELHDDGYDVNAWLCYRDEALRYHAVLNNRFLYLTAEPEEANAGDYAALHALHNTSSAFLPEKLKNGRQAVASEGLIASFFYRFVTHEKIRSSGDSAALSARFASGEPVGAEDLVYLKILSAMSQLDFAKDPLLTEFVEQYISCFPDEREAVIDVFGLVTHFVTVSAEAQKVFGGLYTAGRIGDIERLKAELDKAETFKKQMKAGILSGERALNEAVAPSLWLTADREILPVPWETASREKLKIDVNAATAVDFLALDGVTPENARKLVAVREERGGFLSLQEFAQAKEEICKQAG